MAPKGHFFTQIPQPIQSSSEMKEILEVGSTSIQSLPVENVSILVYNIQNSLTYPYGSQDKNAYYKNDEHVLLFPMNNKG